MWNLIIWALVIMAAFWIAGMILTLGLGVIGFILSGIGTGIAWVFNKIKGEKK